MSWVTISKALFAGAMLLLSFGFMTALHADSKVALNYTVADVYCDNNIVYINQQSCKLYHKQLSDLTGQEFEVYIETLKEQITQKRQEIVNTAAPSAIEKQ